MTKPVSISKKPRKQHTPEFRNEASLPSRRPLYLTSARCSLFHIDGSATGRTDWLPRGSSADSLSHPVSVPGHNQAAVAVFPTGFTVLPS